MKYHDNEVQIINPDGYEFTRNGKFVIDECCVTDGQDPKGYLYAGAEFSVGKDGIITFKVGRKKSDEVADWWKKRIAFDKNTYYEDPDELNFAMIGDLTLYLKGELTGQTEIELHIENIALAQGSYSGRNNWWFGGKECYFTGDEPSDLDDECVTLYGWYGVNNASKALRIVAYRSELGSSVNTITLEYVTSMDASNAVWMSQKLEADRQLCNMTIPGSHDAGMAELHHINVIAKLNTDAIQTQGICVYEQLLCGSRYFDVRVDYDHDKLVSYHRPNLDPEGDTFDDIVNVGANGQAISHIVDQAMYFVKRYPSEFVILKFSHIRSCDGHDPKTIKSKLLDLLGESRYENVLFVPENDEKVKLHSLAYSTIAGKIIAVCDFDEVSQEKGLYRYRDVNSTTDSITANYGELNVYDKYSNTSNYCEMADNQLSKWEDNAEMDESEHLFLLSWTLTLSVLECATGSINELANKANASLPCYLKEHSVLKAPNIVYVDYIDKEVCDVIIALNDKNSKCSKLH